MTRTLAVVLAAAALVAACAGAPPPRPAGWVYRTAQLTPAEREAFVSMVAEVGTRMPDRSVPVCISIRAEPGVYPTIPDSALLRTLSSDRVFVGENRCPRDPHQGLVIVNARGDTLRPATTPGYVDPYGVDVIRHTFFLPDSAFFYVGTSRDLRSDYFECVARSGATSWRTTCHHVSSGIF